MDDDGDGIAGDDKLDRLMPFASAAAISSDFIAREALAMSTVPLIMAAMPVPDPPPVTEMRTSG